MWVDGNVHSAHMQQLSVNIGEHSGQVTLYLYSIANISTIIINIIIIVTVINTTIFIKVTSLQRNLKKFRKVEGMGGEYICVTGCIIAQLTRAWIEPFQPNNPAGHQYIIHVYGHRVWIVYVYTKFVLQIHNVYIHKHKLSPLQTNNPTCHQYIMYTCIHVYMCMGTV